MNFSMKNLFAGLASSVLAAVAISCGLAFAEDAMPEYPATLTPKPAAAPRVNGPTIFGVRPGSPFLYTIPATGDRPMEFSVENLPQGLTVDATTGRITGVLAEKGEYAVVLKAKNAKGEASKKFRIVVGDKICLTPPMGWNSWNCWAAAVDQDKVLKSAKAFVDKGLVNHGWTYINIDDTWQGVRGGKYNAIQGNEKFPDIKKLCDTIHEMGLKAGIYSTPWVTSYAKYCGGASDSQDGAWDKSFSDEKHWKHGKYSFAENDAKQWADWGVDYLKYDWFPNDVEHVRDMSVALRKTNRDIVYSLSNSAPLEHAADWAELANCWRTTGDISDLWQLDPQKREWMFGVSEIGFAQHAWTPFGGPGHWNDPDMLVVGWVGWSKDLHRTKLTPDEQYTHISLWCMLSAPLLIGCDLDRLDDFTLGLLTNDEVLAIDQDSLGRQARVVATFGPVDVFKKDLEDGSWAVGFFNRGDTPQKALFTKLERAGIHGRVHVRDLWRQKDLPDATGSITVDIAPHGVVLLKMTPVK